MLLAAAAIYGVAGDGAGQTIGILGQSNFYLSDVQEFRARFGLPERTPRGKFLLAVNGRPVAFSDPHGAALTWISRARATSGSCMP